MKKVFIQSIVIIAYLSFVGCSKVSPTAVETTGNISGVITRAVDGTAIVGANILSTPATGVTVTDSQGHYSIIDVKVGAYKVTANKSGYYNKTISVSVAGGKTITANISLPDTGSSLGIEWVSIPAGNFTMGSTYSDPSLGGDEFPQHIVFLDTYIISKYEITNAQYKVFIEAGGYINSVYWSTEGWAWKTSNSIMEPFCWSSGQYNNGPFFPNYPIVGVSWYEVYAFCNWAGLRLPTEAEWEKAARGTDTRYYPWGSIWDSTKCNSICGYDTSPDAPPDTFTISSPVGYFTNGMSFYGLHDMAGNVREWVSDWYQSDYYSVSPTTNPTGPTNGVYHVIRSGSWGTYCSDSRLMYLSTTRDWNSPYNRTCDIGFRPAK